jgi:hypothetical protein
MRARRGHAGVEHLDDEASRAKQAKEAVPVATRSTGQRWGITVTTGSPHTSVHLSACWLARPANRSSKQWA